MRVTGIFTGTTSSPSNSLRQSYDRYAIRAGRNLPDKEFRYLRTVIVTAAVHWGFNSRLAPLLLTFQHWAGVSPYTSACALAETYVFVKQSVGPRFCSLHDPCARQRPQAPLLPKLRGQFAEFLNRGSLVHLRRLLLAYRCRFAVRAEAAHPLVAFLGGGVRGLPLSRMGKARPTPLRACTGDFPPMRTSAQTPSLSIRWDPGPFRVPTSGGPCGPCRSGAGIFTCLPSLATWKTRRGLGPDSP